MAIESDLVFGGKIWLHPRRVYQVQNFKKKESAKSISGIIELDTVEVISRLKLKASSYNTQDKKAGRLTFNDRYDSWNKPLLTHEDLIELLKKMGIGCYYCQQVTNIIPTRRRDPYQTTFDRINNSQTHSKDNLKVCCWHCNELRSNDFSSDAFYSKRRGKPPPTPEAEDDCP